MLTEQIHNQLQEINREDYTLTEVSEIFPNKLIENSLCCPLFLPFC